MGAETAVGSILASIGSAAAKAGQAVGSAAKTALPSVAAAATEAGKTFGGQLLKEGGKAALQVGTQVAPLALQFGQIRQTREQQAAASQSMDDLMSQTRAMMARDPYGPVSYSTAGLEAGLEGAKAIGADLNLRRAEADQRVALGGGRSLQGVQDFMEKTAVAYGDRKAQIDLAKAKAASERDTAMSGLNLATVQGLQNYLSSLRGAEVGGMQSIAELLPTLLADLQKQQLFQDQLGGDEELDVTDVVKEKASWEQPQNPNPGGVD